MQHGQIECQVYDKEKIEREIVGISRIEHLFVRYFPESFKKWRETYYFQEPIKLFQHYYDSNYDESLRKIFSIIFVSSGNLIKALRIHNSFEEALSAHGFKIIVDSDFKTYNHRRDLRFIADNKPFQVQLMPGGSHCNVLKCRKRIFEAYLYGTILTGNGRSSGLVRNDENYIYEKVLYKYGMSLPPDSLRYFSLSFALNSTLYLFSSLLIIEQGYFDFFNTTFKELKEMIT